MYKKTIKFISSFFGVNWQIRVMSKKPVKTVAVKKTAGKRKGANGYRLPDPIPVGEIVRDVTKKEWQIGPSVGVGGFGEIYAGRLIAIHTVSLVVKRFFGRPRCKWEGNVNIEATLLSLLSEMLFF
jgi:hypothetical protein